VVVIGGTSASGPVWAPFVLVPSDSMFGGFELAALCGCPTLDVRSFVHAFLLCLIDTEDV
jgi:hypothetical protein